MPQFQIDLGLDLDRWSDLDDFEQGYVEAAFWTIDEEDKDRPLADLADEALADMREDCKDFREGLPKDEHGRTALDLACDYATVRYDLNRAGVDFWLTRNHHGAGFWDRGLGEVGKELTEWAHTFGETNLYSGDDGRLYV